MDTVDWGDVELLKRERPGLVVEALTDGDREVLERAIAEGFDVNVISAYGGSERTALHHAAAAGDVPVIEYLLEHGASASLGVVDPTYSATPLGWAEFFDQPEAADHLRGVAPADERPSE